MGKAPATHKLRQIIRNTHDTLISETTIRKYGRSPGLPRRTGKYRSPRLFGFRCFQRDAINSDRRGTQQYGTQNCGHPTISDLSTPHLQYWALSYWIYRRGEHPKDRARVGLAPHIGRRYSFRVHPYPTCLIFPTASSFLQGGHFYHKLTYPIYPILSSPNWRRILWIE